MEFGERHFTAKEREAGGVVFEESAVANEEFGFVFEVRAVFNELADVVIRGMSWSMMEAPSSRRMKARWAMTWQLRAGSRWMGAEDAW